MDEYELRIETPPSFNFRSTVYSHGWCQLAPFSTNDRGSVLTRVHRLADETVLRLAFTWEKGDDLLVAIEGRSSPLEEDQQQELVVAVRRIFQLDLDLDEFYELTRELDHYRWVEGRGAGRLLRCPTVWEDLVKTLLTTNTTWGSTRNMVRRLTELAGSPQDGGLPFPTALDVASMDREEFGDRVRAGYRSQYLHELATRIASGDLEVEAWHDPSIESADLYQRLRSIKGFGPYAAGTMMKLLGHFDELALDSATRSMFAQVYNDGEPVQDKEIREHYHRFGRWRGLLLWMDLVRRHGG